MKNATKHAELLRSTFKRLMKEHKPEAPEPQEPLRALVRGAMSYDVPDNKAADALKAIEREFVDLNEFRVATDLEIQELLGQRYPAIQQRVAMITLSLNNIFEREHTLSLDRLKTIGKKEARQFLHVLPENHAFVEAYVMLFAFDGHAVPLDSEMLTALVEEEILDEGTSIEDAQKFLEHNVKADECADLYACLRALAYGGKRKK